MFQFLRIFLFIWVVILFFWGAEVGIAKNYYLWYDYVDIVGPLDLGTPKGDVRCKV